MIITERLLFLRGTYPALFLEGAYQGLQVKGDKSNHVVAYSRKLGEQEVIVASTRFHASSAILGSQFWRGQSIVLGEKGGKFRDILSNQEITVEGGELNLQTLFKFIPFAVLERLN